MRLDPDNTGPHFEFSVCQDGLDLEGQSGGAVYNPERSTNNLCIGWDPFKSGRYFSGVIDDISFFIRTLADFKIEAFYRR